MPWSATWGLRRGAHSAATVARKEFIAHLKLCSALIRCSGADLRGTRSDALIHARNQAIVRLWFDEWAYLSVRDDGGASVERAITPAPAHVEGGRGLYIVQALARELNIEGTGAGWIVTAKLPVQAKASSSTCAKSARGSVYTESVGGVAVRTAWRPHDSSPRKPGGGHSYGRSENVYGCPRVVGSVYARRMDDSLFARRDGNVSSATPDLSRSPKPTITILSY